MQTATDIIKRLGGTSAVASALGLTPSTVSSWKTSGRVPNWRRPALIAVAKEAGIALADGDFEPAARPTPEKSEAA